MKKTTPKTNPKKLNVQLQTIRELDRDDLGKVSGGYYTIYSCHYGTRISSVDW